MKLVSLNINWEKQWDAVKPFLSSCDADVVCLQEVRKQDIETLKEILGMEHVLFGETIILSLETGVIETVALFSRTPLREAEIRQYAGPTGALLVHSEEPASWEAGNEKRILVMGTIDVGGVSYRVATTHFTWTREGNSTPKQLQDLEAMLSALHGEKEIILAGDFNAPRGKETFTTLATVYTDTIPETYVTSIDVKRHRVAGTPNEKYLRDKMVDGLFVTPQYSADTHLVFDISDHAAIVATITKNTA